MHLTHYINSQNIFSKYFSINNGISIIKKNEI